MSACQYIELSVHLLIRRFQKTFEALFGQQVIDLEIPGVRAFQDFLESAICSDVPQVCDLVQGMLEPSDKEKQNPHINQVLVPKRRNRNIPTLAVP